MKRIPVALLMVMTLAASACTAHVAAHPPRRVFVEGRWLLAPSPKAVWVPAHYVIRNGKRVLVTGHWRR